jgi:hypothetical protein
MGLAKRWAQRGLRDQPKGRAVISYPCPLS